MTEEHGTWLNPVAEALPGWLRPYVDVNVLYAALIILLLAVLAWQSSRRLQLVPRNKAQGLGEWIYELLVHFCRSMLGPHGDRFVGIIGSFFLYIFALNVIGLIPGFLSPTARLNTTVGLALMAITLAQFAGIQINGLRYFTRFLITIRDIPVFINPLKIVEEAVKPLSLSIRLFGNIFGDDMAVAYFALMGAGFLGVFFDPTAAAGILPKLSGLLGALFGVATTAMMIVFAIFIAFIQAFVFSILTSAYILFAVEME